MKCFRLLLEHLAWIEHHFYKLHKRFKEVRESVRNDERCGRSKEVRTPELGSHWTDSQQGILCWGFKGVQEEISLEVTSTFKSSQWHFHQDNAPVHNSILVTDYLTKMGIKTVPRPPYSPDLAPCDLWLFATHKENRYETIEEMKEAVMKVIDTFTQEDFDEGLWEVVGTVQQVHCSWRRLLQRGLEFHVCTINKSAHMKKSGNLFNDPLKWIPLLSPEDQT